MQVPREPALIAAALLIATGLLLATGSSYYAHAAQGRFRIVLQFDVTDARHELTARLSRDVMLYARRAVDANGRHIGWDLAAADRRLKGSNFFYECLCGHGPRPHDLYAWHFVTSYYPPDRQLPVYGYPLEVRARCLECEATGTDGYDARFTRGLVEISVRSLPQSNRRQRRIPERDGRLGTGATTRAPLIADR